MVSILNLKTFTLCNLQKITNITANKDFSTNKKGESQECNFDQEEQKVDNAWGEGGKTRSTAFKAVSSNAHSFVQRQKL